MFILERKIKKRTFLIIGCGFLKLKISVRRKKKKGGRGGWVGVLYLEAVLREDVAGLMVGLPAAVARLQGERSDYHKPLLLSSVERLSS